MLKSDDTFSWLSRNVDRTLDTNYARPKWQMATAHDFITIAPAYEVRSQHLRRAEWNTVPIDFYAWCTATKEKRSNSKIKEMRKKLAVQSDLPYNHIQVGKCELERGNRNLTIFWITLMYLIITTNSIYCYTIQSKSH